MENTIDPRSYATLPRFDVRAGLALGRALVTAAPASTGPLVGRELDRVRAALAALETAWQPGAAATPTLSDRRPADLAVDAAWGALHARLAAWGRLPGATHPEVARAATVLAMLFPDGLGFLKLPYERQWAESQRRLDHIDTAELAAELDALAGPAFLASVRTAHANYGAALGITEIASERSEIPVSLREPAAALRAAMTRYALRLIGNFDDEDPAAVGAVRAALRPIDDYRAALAARANQARTRTSGDPDVDVDPSGPPSN